MRYIFKNIKNISFIDSPKMRKIRGIIKAKISHIEASYIEIFLLRLRNILSQDKKLLANLLEKTNAFPNFLQRSNLVHKCDRNMRKYRDTLNF